MATDKYIHTVSPEELDYSGRATVPALYKIIIGSIGQEIRRNGFGVDTLSDQGLTWALARCSMEFSSRPALYEDIVIEVWWGEENALSYGKCIRVTGNDGREICKGVTEWCVLDKESRKPVKPDLLPRDISGEKPCSSPKRIRPFLSSIKHLSRVGYSECDFNGHLNNARYIEMFFDLLPQKFVSALQKARLDVNFRREIACGSTTEAHIMDNGFDDYAYCLYFDGAPACCASLRGL